MKKFNINIKALTEFISLCERAEKLGLEFIKNKKTGEYQFTVMEVSGGLHVQVQKYQLTTWNGKGPRTSGHTILEVWLKTDAGRLAGHIDASIADTNPNRWTEIKKSPHTLVSMDDLKFFISRHSKSKQ